MSFRDLLSAANLDSMIRHRLKLAVQLERPPRDLRRRLLQAALHARAPEAEIRVPEHLIQRNLPGEYRDIQHRLSMRALIYTTPFGTAAFGLLN